MTQEDVRQLLSEHGGEATVPELSELAQEKYPDRTLHAYLRERLQSMEKNGLVERIGNDRTKWRLTDKGCEGSITYPISEVDSIVNEDELSKKGFTLVNLVGSLRLERELDLSALSVDLENTEYHPETYPSMIYRPFGEGSVSILTPSSGRLAIVGAKSKQELIDAVEEFLSTINNLGIETDKTSDDMLIQNVVVNYDFEREFDLSVVAIALDLNNVEYEPEQFPGLIYRSHSGNATILMFASGKVVITGAKTYLNSIQACDELCEKLEGIGVEFPKEKTSA
jgi:transcription initiation factor TFIID TATA-box-binding protein